MNDHPPHVGDDRGVSGVEVDQSGILHDDARDQHADERRQIRQRDGPADKVRRQTEHGQLEQHAPGPCLVADDRVDDAPEHQAEQQETEDPGELAVARAKGLGTGAPPAGWLPAVGAPVAVAPRAEQVQP